MRLIKPHEQIFLFLGDTPADLGRPFVRLQEYFESPSKLFRRKLFTLKKFKAWYAEHHGKGKFSYYTDYNGYNVPGDIVNAFFCLYADSLTSDEISLLKMLTKTSSDYYVIGSPSDSADTIDHELAHAFWYLFREYREGMISMMESYDFGSIFRYLRKRMYATDMLADEASAYLMFDDALLHRAGVSTREMRGLRGGMLGLFKAYKARFIRL